jgi:DNA repair exonuclease SbcCD ATPase subunit
LEQERGKLLQLQKERESVANKVDSLLILREDIEEATFIIQTVSKETQEQVQFFIEDIAQEAINSIFGQDTYIFRAEFVMRRGKTECDFFLMEGENRIQPMEATGGGVVDIIAFALRAALWSLDKTHRNVLILDEPFRFLSRDLHEQAGDMLRTLSQRLGLQIIMVSHSGELIETADRVFVISKQQGISKIQIE